MGYFAKNLKLLRKLNNMSQVSLGKMIGVSGAYIQQLEKSSKKNPSFGLIFDICNIFDVAPMELLERDLSKPDFEFSESSELSNSLKEFCLKKDKELSTTENFNNLFKKPSEARNLNINITYNDLVALSHLIDINKDNEVSVLIRNITDNLFLTIYNAAKDRDIEFLNNVHILYRSIWELCTQFTNNSHTNSSLEFLNSTVQSLKKMNSSYFDVNLKKDS